MTRPWLVLCRLSALAALAVSAALYAHYIDPVEASFCAAGSGCEAVRRSAFSYFGSRFLNVPLVGLVAYLVVLVASVRDPDGKALPVLAGLGGALGVALLLIQTLAIGKVCALCVVVDGAAVLAGVFAVLHHRVGREAAPFDPLRPWAWYMLAALAVGMLPLWSAVRPAPAVPGVIRALYEPGKINVIEFADFECPFCRRLHPILKEAMERYSEERIHFRRMNVPLAQHEFAAPASRAYLCAKDQGKGEALADRLMAVSLSSETIRREAADLGLDMGRFGACVKDPEVDRRIAAERRVLEQAGLQGLPTTYIGGKRFVGVPDRAALDDALERAGSGEPDPGVPAPIFFGAVAVIAGAVVWRGKRQHGRLMNESGD